MSKVLDFLFDLAGRVSLDEIAMLAALVALMIAGLAVPHLMSARTRRQFTDRDQEFQRLQNM